MNNLISHIVVKMLGEPNVIPEDKGNHVRQLRTSVLFGGGAPSRMIPLGQSRRPVIIFTDGFCVSVLGGKTWYGSVILVHATHTYVDFDQELTRDIAGGSKDGRRRTDLGAGRCTCSCCGEGVVEIATQMQEVLGA